MMKLSTRETVKPCIQTTLKIIKYQCTPLISWLGKELIYGKNGVTNFFKIR